MELLLTAASVTGVTALAVLMAHRFLVDAARREPIRQRVVARRRDGSQIRKR